MSRFISTHKNLVFLFLLIGLVSCHTGSETESKPPFKGLITFTSSGITFLECTQDRRYRILDGQHKVGKAMGDRRMVLNQPLYIEMDGVVSDHTGKLEFEQQFEQIIEVTEVAALEDDLPSICDHHVKPIIDFNNPGENFTISFNYYVPAVILSKPLYGWLMYFPIQDEKFPKLDSEESARLALRSHGEEAEFQIMPKSCRSEAGGELWTHSLELVFRGDTYYACGGSEAENQSVEEDLLLPDFEL